MSRTALVWFRHDLRLADNPALYHAAEASGAVVPVFVWAPEEEGDWAPGGAHRWWLHHSLQALDADLREKGSRLVLRQGNSLDVLRELIKETGAQAVYWNKRYEPALRERDLEVARALREDGVAFHVFESRLLHNPERVETKSGGPYHVYGPFRRKLEDALDVGAPLPKPRMGETKAPPSWPTSVDLDALALTPEAQDGVDWAEGFRATWTSGKGEAPGERGAHRRLEHFTDRLLIDYADDRDRLDRDGTSMLSPRLHHGELSPRQVWTSVQGWVRNGPMRETADAYLQEVIWREFAYHLLYHYPRLPTEPLKEKFAAFPWAPDGGALARWQRGQTGYPVVDAGMRQLWEIGWMHNRARLLTGSFLTKDLLVPWQEGAGWFWDCLVGGDLGNNSLNWQWVAGCGADAQPFFRIFNPVSQGERYDPEGAYVRRYVPELKGLPNKYIHQPWNAPADVLEKADVRLGETYPEPIVDHGKARDRAMAAYEEVR